VPLEGRISGSSTGFEVTVPGRQSIRALRNSIPLAGAPTSIETSLRGLLFSALFLPVVSRQGRVQCLAAGTACKDFEARKTRIAAPVSFSRLLSAIAGAVEPLPGKGRYFC
jgi:hypothetical protein